MPDVTGREGKTPSAEDKELWRKTKADGNIGLRVPDSVIVVDIDNYEKGERPFGAALDTVSSVELQAGCEFPATWSLRSRDDGSEKRFYRVPMGLRWRSGVGAGVDIVQHAHRYVNAGFNPGAGKPEQWYGPGDELSELPPRPEDLPELPEALQRELVSDRSADYPGLGTAQEARELLDAMPKGDISPCVEEALKRAVADLGGLKGSRHDKTLRHVLDLVMLGHCGALGAYAALETLGEEFVKAVRPDRDSHAVAVAEFAGLREHAGKVVKGRSLSDDDRESHLMAMESMAPGGVWHPDTPKPWLDIDDFWNVRPELRDLKQFARSRRVGPWAMLGYVLARAAATIPPHVVLPPLVGGHGSLNLFVALVGTSGAGKGASAGAASEWLLVESEVHTAPLGSGEGMLKEYAYKEKPGSDYVQVGKLNSVLFDTPEVDTVAALKGRSSSTLLPELRKAWSGESLGFGYADQTKALRICSHRYRLCWTVGVQPGRASALLDDADGGTPQRFVWLPMQDAHAPDERPESPGEWKLPSWKSGFVAQGPVEGAEDMADANLLDVPVAQDELIALSVTPVAREAVDAQSLARLRGEPVDGLDGHRLQVQLKVAAALMWLNGREDGVNEEDWELAGYVMSVSNRTREEVQKTLRAESRKANQARGFAEGERSAIRDQVAYVEKMNHFCSRILEKLRVQDGLAFNKLMKTFGPDKEHAEVALERLVEIGEIRREKFEYRGRPGQRFWLADT